MGEVIQMVGWKDNLMKQRRTKAREAHGIETDNLYGIMVEIADKLREADRLTTDLYNGRLGTVRLREEAAIRSFQLIEDAHQLAETVGIRINKNPEGSWTYGHPPTKGDQSAQDSDKE